MTGKGTTRLSLEDLEATKGATRPDAPEGEELGPDFWARAEVKPPRAKQSVHLRVDADVLEFFKSEGPGHLTRMNAVLRSYMEARRTGAAEPPKSKIKT